MNPLKLSWKSIWHRPLPALLSILLFALGTGLVVLLFQVNTQVQEQFERNLAEIDLVVGAKGSPLQLILASMYQVDAPTGNIPLDKCQAFFNPKHPLIKRSVPISQGDSYKTHRIIGTEHSYVDLYNGKVAQGKLWEADFEVCLGAAVAQKFNLKIGDKFNSSHGLVDDDNLVHTDAHPFEVVGIFAPSGSVLDQVILCSTPSVWKVHGHGEEGHDHDAHEGQDHADHDGHDHEGHDHEGHEDHAGHDHEDHDGHDHFDGAQDHQKEKSPTDLDWKKTPGQEVTAIMVQMKNRSYQSLNFARNINENTELLAASPAIEINRLYGMMGSGADILEVLAYVIVFVSVLSIFFSLLQSLADRKSELALMRSLGGSRKFIFGVILLEGLLLSAMGLAIGLLLAHIGVQLIGNYFESGYRYQISGWRWLWQENYVLLIGLVLGMLAACWPAWKASTTEIGEVLIKD